MPHPTHLCYPIADDPAFSPLYAPPPKDPRPRPSWHCRVRLQALLVQAPSRRPPKPCSGRPGPIRFPTPPEAPPQQAHTLPTGPETPPHSPQQRPLPGPAWFPAPRRPAPYTSRVIWDMLPDCLSAEGERRCRQLLAGTTARLRSRPAAAAVLVPLCLVRGVPALLYTLRSSRLLGRHKGQVSFPGGKCDPDDQDVIHTALRETQEELGLEVPEEHVWGVLQPVYDPGKATVVPVLANVGPLDLQSLRPNPEEVDEVFELSLAHLLQTQNQGYTHFCQGGHFRYTMPVFLNGPHRVWGLTAIITEFTLKLLAPDIYQPYLVIPELPRS